MSEYGFPTETIDLPSQGLLYPDNSPLRTGRVDIKYMTAKEEDILTSTNLIQKGTVLDKLMDSLVVSKGVKADDMLLGDLNAVMVASRILAYGKDYEVKVTCKACQVPFDYTVDLAQLQSQLPEADGWMNGERELVLPTGVTITYKLLTRGDEKAVQTEVNSLKKFNGSVDAEASTRLKYTITSVNGVRDKKTIRDFVDVMIIRDVRALRQEIKRVSPDIDFDINITCTACNAENKMRMPFGANFFWPDLGA
jgi:hypothetical protein